MAVYRLTDYSNAPSIFSYSLEQENIPSIEACYVDSASTSALNRIIEGPILGIQDLIGAEIYLRALIFHEQIRPIGPGIQVQQYSIDDKEPFVFTTWSSGANNYALDEIHKHVHHNGYICPIDWVCTFDSIESENYRVAKQNEIHKRYKHLLVSKSSSILNYNLGRFEKICESIDDYSESVFEKSDELISRFLVEIPKSRIPTYFSKTRYSNMLSIQMHDRLKTFLSPIETDWEKYCNDIAPHCLSIQCPPFLAIILKNAINRQNIVAEILDFREKFKKARMELWDIIDDALIRNNGNLKMTHRFLKNVETEAKKIIPTALNDRDSGIKFDFFNAAISLGNIIYNITAGNGIPPSDVQVILRNMKRKFSLQSSKIVYQNMNLLLNDWYELEKHFTESELESLQNSMTHY